MFNFFKRKRSKEFKWEENPKGRFLEQEYWNDKRIGYKPISPIICIDFDDGGSITPYKSFGEIEQKWNHFLFENNISDDYPTYFIDSKLTISILQYHPEKFIYPVPEETINHKRFIDLIKKCRIKNFNEFQFLESSNEILKKLLNNKITINTNYNMQIESEFNGDLPEEYLKFLENNPNGNEVTFNEYKDEDPEFEGRDWTLMSETALLESWEMNGVGKARNFECLQLYIAVQKEFSDGNWTTSNVGNIELDRIEKGFVFGDENGDYLYLDATDSYSVWVYFHDGGDVLKIADSFTDFIGK